MAASREEQQNTASQATSSNGLNGESDGGVRIRETISSEQSAIVAHDSQPEALEEGERTPVAPVSRSSSPQLWGAEGSLSEPTTPPPEAQQPEDELRNQGLPPPFPAPTSRTSSPLSSPGVHPGPADTSSVASSMITPQLRPAFMFNPRAQPFQNVAHLYLRRGPGPGARDPMAIPGEAPVLGPRADPAAIERRRRDAVYHMAMVYHRLMSVDMDLEAEELADRFRDIFGPEYDDEQVRVIQEEPDEPPDPRNDDDDDDVWV